MKKFLSIITSAVCCAGMILSSVSASAEVYESLTYEAYDSDGNGTSDSVRITDCESGAISVNIPAAIDGMPVKEIGNSAFYQCTSLTEVTIPDSVEKIGMTSFGYCSSLTSITIPDSVKNIDDSAFYVCKSLESIDFPESIERIGSYAFLHTKWYNDQPDGIIYIGNVLYEYKGEAAEGEHVTVKDGTTGISDSAFYGCKLSGITIPNTVKYIGSQAFFNTPKLLSVIVPESVESIGEKAFCYCSSLKEITIENPECDIYAGGETICSTIMDESKVYFGKIYGAENSTAQAYAEENGYSFTAKQSGDPLPGDINNDGKLTALDASKIFSAYKFYYYYKAYNITDMEVERGDINGDGKLTAADASSVFSIYKENYRNNKA